MKNYIISFALIVILISCSQDDVCIRTENTLPSSSALVNELSNFNDSLFLTKPHTRVSRKKIMDGMSIVVADAIGAYGVGRIGLKVGAFFGQPHVGAAIGALIGGAYSSYECYNTLNSTRACLSSVQRKPIEVAAAYVPALETESLVQENLPHKISLNYSDENNYNIEFGAKHNIIVSNLQANNFVLDSKVKQYLSADEFRILNSDEFIAGYDSIVNKVSECAIKGEIPESADNDVSALLMNLFATVLDTYSNNVDDIEFIINKYIDAVQRTEELSNEEKENIYQALSVAASSYELWNLK